MLRGETTTLAFRFSLSSAIETLFSFLRSASLIIRVGFRTTLVKPPLLRFTGLGGSFKGVGSESFSITVTLINLFLAVVIFVDYLRFVPHFFCYKEFLSKIIY